MEERILERRRGIRRDARRRRLRRTAIVVAGLVLAAVLVVVERSPLVALAEVHVTGTERLSPERVRQTAALQLGTSTLRLQLERAARRVESLPLVADATAQRVNPLTVRIHVRERRPVAVVTGRGPAALIDRAGVVFSARGDGDGGAEARRGLPEIALGRAPVPEAGTRAEQRAALGNAHRVLTELPPGLTERVVAYRAVSADELVLRLATGVEVAFGRAEDIPEKVRSLRAVLSALDEPPTRIDVRVPSTPVVEPAGHATPTA